MDTNFDPARYTDALDEKVRSVALSWVGDRSGLTFEDGEDMIQEGRLAIWKWIAAHPEEECGPGLARMLTTQACRDLERRSRRARDEIEIPLGYDAAQAASQDFDAALVDILSKIVNDEREAVVAVLIVYEGLTVREAADYLEVPTANVQRIITRLRERAIELGVTQ